MSPLQHARLPKSCKNEARYHSCQDIQLRNFNNFVVSPNAHPNGCSNGQDQCDGTKHVARVLERRIVLYIIFSGEASGTSTHELTNRFSSCVAIVIHHTNFTHQSYRLLKDYSQRIRIKKKLIRRASLVPSYSNELFKPRLVRTLYQATAS